MGTHTVSAVMERSRTKEASQRFVLVCLAHHVHDRRRGPLLAWPSTWTIAYETALSEATVKRALRSLVQVGEIIPKGRHPIRTRGGRQFTNIYELRLPPATRPKGGVTMNPPLTEGVSP